MASTNKTTNYELSQYVGTDKPTYLGDYNSDMSKIDTAIHGVATSVGTETGRINVLETNVGTMADLTTTVKSSLVGAINEVNSKANSNTTNIGTLSNLETVNKTTIVNAINEVVEKFNLSNIQTYGKNDFSKVSGTTPSTYDMDITVATNNDGSIAKIYGSVSCSGTNGSGVWKVNTAMRPTSDLTIKGKIRQFYTSSSNYTPTGVQYWSTFTIRTNGDLEVSTTWANNTNNVMMDLYVPCVYFLTDFGDVPQN